MKARRPILLFIALALCSCAEMQERARQEQAERDAAYGQALARQCEAIGYQNGTEGFRQCMLQLHATQQAQYGQIRSIYLQNMLQQQGRPIPPPCYVFPPAQQAIMAAGGNCR